MPSWPSGVVTAQLTFGKGITADGNQTGATLVVQPIFNGSKSAVWSATGIPILPFTLNYTAAVGGYQVVTVPVVDQSGWLDDGQNAYTNWYYSVTETPQYGDIQGTPRTKAWQPLTAQATLGYDFDLIPDGSAGLPVSTPQTYATLASPALTGTPTAPTAAAGTNSTQIATTAFVAAALAAGLLLDVPEWQPNTVYTLGEFALNPSGQIVQAIAAFTSGATYNSANWAPMSLTPSAISALIASSAQSLMTVGSTVNS